MIGPVILTSKALSQLLDVTAPGIGSRPACNSYIQGFIHSSWMSLFRGLVPVRPVVLLYERLIMPRRLVLWFLHTRLYSQLLDVTVPGTWFLYTGWLRHLAQSSFFSFCHVPPLFCSIPAVTCTLAKTQSDAISSCCRLLWCSSPLADNCWASAMCKQAESRTQFLEPSDVLTISLDARFFHNKHLGKL